MLKKLEALQPLNAFTAPFYIQVLRGYAEEIEKMFPGAGDVAKKLDETTDKKVIVIHVKDDSPEAATPRESGNQVIKNLFSFLLWRISEEMSMIRTVILDTKSEAVYTSKPRELVFMAEFNALGELSMTQTAGNKQMDQETLLRGMSLAMMEFAGSLAQDGTKKARTELQERFRDIYASTLMKYWVNDAWESSESLMEVHDGGDQEE